MCKHPNHWAESQARSQRTKSIEEKMSVMPCNNMCWQLVAIAYLRRVGVQRGYSQFDLNSLNAAVGGGSDE